MSDSRTLTIQLSPEESDRLETEAKRLKMSPDALAQRILSETLLNREQPATNARETLLRLREIGRKMPSIDAVQLARESREDLSNRGLF